MYTYLNDVLDNKGDIDSIQWIVLGNHFASAAEEETAF